MTSTPPHQCDSPKSFEPYGFLLHGGRRGNATPPNALLDQEGGSSTSSIHSESVTPSPTTAHGKHLAQACDFIVPPPLEPVEREMPTRCRTLFVGQMRFETSVAEVRWMIKHLTGVTAMKVDTRGPGCFVVFLADDADAFKVRELNQRVLMDHQGFWYARTSAGASTMSHYVKAVLPRLMDRKRTLHLPLDTLVVEETRSRRPRPSPSAAASPNKAFRPSSLGGFHQQYPTLPAPMSQQYRSGTGTPTAMLSASPSPMSSHPATPQVFSCGTPESSYYPVGFHRHVPEYVASGAEVESAMF